MNVIFSECNCNGHAESCHYDENMYNARMDKGIQGSGGVCDLCQHNTEGPQCESCLQWFYQDPTLQLNDTEICKPCDCEPDGTTNEGLCDQTTDEEEGLVAGKCHCKTFTDGPRCAECKNGYWNFTAENPDGCQGTRIM